MIDAQAWIEAATCSLRELVEVYMDANTMAPADYDASDATCATMIGLVSKDNAAQIVLLVSKSGADALAKSLLGFDPEEAIDHSDMADAVGEILNITAGMIKSAMSEDDADLHMTLPTFVDGSLEAVGGQIATSERLRLGSVDTEVVVLSPDHELNARQQSA